MHSSNKYLRVSIVIPVYNEAAHLPACLDAIARQSVLPYEVIVVDNNSTDSTVAIAESYDFVRVLREPRQGVVHARDKGFNSARGEIIGRIDADTRVSVTWVSDIKAAFQANSSSAAITGQCSFYDVRFSRVVSVVHAAVYYRLQVVVAGTEILWGSNMAIKRTVWRQARAGCLNSNSVPEDIDLSLVLADQGFKVTRVPSVTAGVSLRRGKLSLLDIAAYLRWWPRVYQVHRRYFAAAIIWFMYAAVCATAAIYLLIPMLRSVYIRSRQRVRL